MKDARIYLIHIQECLTRIENLHNRDKMIL
jgi:hypothetical protein